MKKRILVADDEINVAKVLKDRFTHWGYEVEIALDGEQTLKKVASFKPHLIVLDVRMPKVNGIEVMETTKKKYPHIGILILTASQSQNTINGCMQKGADGLILKPFTAQGIKNKVEEILKIKGMSNTHD